MTIVEITGGMLCAARSLTGLSQQELADRVSISGPCLTAWEGSSGSVPNAGVRALHRVVSRLRPKASFSLLVECICSAPRSDEAFSGIRTRIAYMGLTKLLPPPTTEPAIRTAAAERMRRHRQRRRDGLRCLIIELRETEVEALIKNGLLQPENRHDYDSVQSALYAFLDRALGELRDA